jgi:hypothetical protein
MTFRSCVRCHGATHSDVLERAAGDAGPIALQVESMPILACDKGHRQFLEPDFPRRLLEHLLHEDEGRLPAGEAKGLLVKHYHCGHCGARLNGHADHPHTFRFDLALDGSKEFHIALTAPVYRCPACSREQVHSLQEVRRRTPEALTRVFQAAGIPPA